MDLRGLILGLRGLSFGPERTDFGPERADMGPERADLEPEGGRMDSPKGGWMSGNTTLCPVGHRAFGAAAQIRAKLHRELMTGEESL